MDRNIGDRKKRSDAIGSWRRRWVSSLALLVVAGLTFVPAFLMAAHDTGVFELDGNATTTASDDWDEVCHQVLSGDCSTLNNTNGATAVTWVAEPNHNDSIFQTGGSKDPNDISSWRWTSGSVPDKDDLLHGYAARYSIPPTPDCPAGNGSTKCELLFFGSDRYDNSGDAQQGFWFFQNRITPNANGTFTGVHKAGDILVVSDFSVGGTTSIISVFKWDPTCTQTNKPDGGCADSNLRTLASSGNANCGTAAAHDAFCGIVNPQNGGFAPWTFLDKSGNNTYLQGEFYEGGVILSSSLLGGGVASECFSSVASETRSSTSTTAVLKDFILGNFGDCETHITTTPKQNDGTNIPPGGLTIGNGANDSGKVLVKDSAVLVINGTSTWSGTLKFFLCGPIATNATCSTGGTQIGTTLQIDQTTNPSPATIVSSAATVTQANTFDALGNATSRYCWRADFTSDNPGAPPNASDSAATECFVVKPVQPGLITSATASVTIGDPISDSATLSLTANKPGSPVINPTTQGAAAGGSITFKLYGPSATNVCIDSGTGANLVFTSGLVDVTGNNTYGPVSFTPTKAGTYRWIASYTGDLPNTKSATGACGDTNEVSVVNPKTPTLSTVASSAPPDGSPLGTALTDSVTISGLATPSNATAGTITLKAFGPFNGIKVCTGTAVYTSVISVSADGTFNSFTNGDGGEFKPTTAGYYNWTADYAPATGDVNNVAKSAPCSDDNESSLLIQLQPTVTTAQFFYPNDSATVTVSSGGGNLAGSVHFQVWTNSTCAGTALIDQTVTLAAPAALTKTVETTNTTIRVNATTSLYWKVDYASTNTAHKDVTGTCGKEQSVITVDNNFTPPTP